MIVGTLRITLYLPGTRSLKEKRRIIRSIKDRVRHKFNVSFVESDHQDVWQTAEFGVAAAGNETAHLHSVLDNVLNAVSCSAGVQVTNAEREVL